MPETKSYTEMRRDFYQKYQEKIVPCVRKYERERKNKLIITLISSIIFSILGALMFFYAGKDLEGDTADFVIKLGGLFLGIAVAVWPLNKKALENKIKSKIMPIVCSCFADLKWSKNNYQYGAVFSASGVVPNSSRKHYDDIFKGSYKEVGFEIVEGCFTIGSGKNTRIVFDGVIVKLEMNKDFTSHTIISPDNVFHKSPVNDLKHTVLEDAEFEKKFDVFTNDEVDARYLITPTFMERLKSMKTAFKASKFQCAFYGNLLLVALHINKDVFSICSLFKPIDDSQQYFQMYEEIVSIIKLIDHFKLDQKIGL